MKFRQGNRIYYGQDFRYKNGVPSGIEFTVERWTKGFILRAPGYGMPDNYGNGCLYLYFDTLSKTTTERLKKAAGGVI